MNAIKQRLENSPKAIETKDRCKEGKTVFLGKFLEIKKKKSECDYKNLTSYHRRNDMYIYILNVCILFYLNKCRIVDTVMYPV